MNATETTNNGAATVTVNPNANIYTPTQELGRCMAYTGLSIALMNNYVFHGAELGSIHKLARELQTFLDAVTDITPEKRAWGQKRIDDVKAALARVEAMTPEAREADRSNLRRFPAYQLGAKAYAQ